MPFQFDRSWHYLGDELPGTAVKVMLTRLAEVGRPTVRESNEAP